jgi:hypothetical protein
MAQRERSLGRLHSAVRSERYLRSRLSLTAGRFISDRVRQSPET